MSPIEPAAENRRKPDEPEKPEKPGWWDEWGLLVKRAAVVLGAIAALVTIISSIGATFYYGSQLVHRAEKADGDVAALQTEIKGLGAAVIGVQTEVKGMRRDIGEVRDGLDGVREEVSDVKAEVAYIKGHLDRPKSTKMDGSIGFLGPASTWLPHLVNHDATGDQ